MARQVCSALGVAIVVALYSPNDAHLLGSFRRGWIFMATVALLAAVVSIVVRHQPQDAAIRIYEQRRLNEPASGNV